MKLKRFSDFDGVPIGYMMWCPGCKWHHGIWVEKPNERCNARWTFNGDLERPTFNPSVLIFHEENGQRVTDCHFYVTSGMVQFLGDCRHSLAGKTVPLPELPRRD